MKVENGGGRGGMGRGAEWGEGWNGEGWRAQCPWQLRVAKQSSDHGLMWKNGKEEGKKGEARRGKMKRGEGGKQRGKMFYIMSQS